MENYNLNSFSKQLTQEPARPGQYEWVGSFTYYYIFICSTRDETKWKDGWMVGWLAGLTGLLVERNYFKNPGRQPLINALRSLEPGLLFVMTLLCQACVLRSLAGLHKLKTFFFLSRQNRYAWRIDLFGSLGHNWHGTLLLLWGGLEQAFYFIITFRANRVVE